MPVSSKPQGTNPDVLQERHGTDASPETHCRRDRFVTDRICEHLRMDVPAGQPFTSASLNGVVPSRNTVSHVLKELNEKGFFARIACGVYVHDGRFPVGRKVIRSAPRPAQKQTRIEKIRAYISEHFSPGQSFQVNDIAVPGFGSAVNLYLAALKRSGYLVSAGYGRYAVRKDGQAVAGVQFLRPRLRAEVLGLPEARTFGAGDFQHLGNRRQLGNALETLAREGTVTRVGPAQYIRADSRPAEIQVPFSARVLQRIRELPPGQTFTRRSSMFDDLGKQDTIRGALEYLLSCRKVTRVAWGTYINADMDFPQGPGVIFTIRQQALLQIEARVPHGQEFTVEVLTIPKSLKALNNALAELNAEGIIERVALGVYVRTSPSVQSVTASDKTV